MEIHSCQCHFRHQGSGRLIWPVIESTIVLLLSLSWGTSCWGQEAVDSKQVCRSVDELLKWKMKDGRSDVEFDFKAYMTLVSVDGTQVRVQDQGKTLRLRVAAKVSQQLCQIRAGAFMRFRGRANRDESDVVKVQLLDFENDLAADHLEPVPAMLAPGTQSTPPNRFAFAEGEIQEILKYREITHVNVRMEKHSFEVFQHGGNQQLLSQHLGQRWRFTGCLRRIKNKSRRRPMHQLALMNGLQMVPAPRPGQDAISNLGTSSTSESSQSDSTVLFEGVVVFSDFLENVSIVNGDERFRIKTTLAHYIVPGTKIRGVGIVSWDHGLDVACYRAKFTEIVEVAHVKISDATQLDSLDDLFVKSRLPPLVRLKATIDFCIFNEGTIDYHLRSSQHKAIARVPFSRHASDFRFQILATGTEIEFSGMPVRQSFRLDTQGQPSSNKPRVLVGSPRDIRVLTRPLTISVSRLVAGAVLICIGLTCGGFWILRLRSRIKASDRTLTDFDHSVQTAFGAMQCGFLIVDEHTRILRSNDSLGSFFGVEPALNSRLGQYLSSIDHLIESPSSMSDLIDASMRAPDRVFSAEFPMRDGKRTIRVFTCSIDLERLDSHSRLWLFEDVSEKRQLESELQHSQKMDAVGRLSGAIAHDFNNLLMVIMSSLGMIRENATGEGAVGDPPGLASAELAVKRASELTQQLLGFARRQRLEKKPISAVSLVNAVEVLASLMTSPMQKLLIERECERITLNVDPGRIEQAIFNLCINAIDATQEHGGQVTLTISSVMDPLYGWSARFSVQDNGPGITRDDQKKIFDPFFTTKPLDRGTGLGLSVALGIVEQHGGRIECHSTCKQGTRFDMILPAISNVARIDERSLTSETNGNTNSDAHRSYPSLSVLVVEDDPSVRVASCLMLEKLGHQAEPVENAMMGIQRLASNTYDLVLLDLMLPEMPGIEAYHEIRSGWPDLPILFCSGNGDAETLIQNGCGSDTPPLLAKPFTIHQMKSSLDSIIGSKAREQGSKHGHVLSGDQTQV